jgi:hypothetical protein
MEYQFFPMDVLGHVVRLLLITANQFLKYQIQIDLVILKRQVVQMPAKHVGTTKIAGFLVIEIMLTLTK